MQFKERLKPKRTREQLQQAFGELVMQLGGIQVDLHRLQQREEALLSQLAGLDAEARALPQEPVATPTAPIPSNAPSEVADEKTAV